MRSEAGIWRARLLPWLLLSVLASACLPGSAARLSPDPPSETHTQAGLLGPDEVVVIGQGMAAFNGDIAAAQEEAVWDAKRNAVEQAVGIFLKSHTVGSGFQLEDDEIHGRTQGFIRRWEIIEGTRRIETLPDRSGDGNKNGKGRQILHIEVRATVGLLPLVHKLADITDVYKDLERPRLRVEIVPDTLSGRTTGKAVAKTDSKGGLDNCLATARRVETIIAGELRAQGFDVASEGTAEILLKGTLDLVPTVHMGDRSAPYGIGDTLAACRATLALQVLSVASEDLLCVRHAEATGRSFDSDEEALHNAATELTRTLLDDSARQFVPDLLVRWAHERQEGHVVVVHAIGLSVAEGEALKARLEEMRGFRRFVEPPTADRLLVGGGTGTKSSVRPTVRRVTWRFLTRRDTRSLRRDLADLTLQDPSGGGTKDHWKINAKLAVLNDRGPVIECATRSFASTSSH